MPSKSQLFGQADIWDLSDYYGGENGKTSFKNFKPAPGYSSQVYPLDSYDGWSGGGTVNALRYDPVITDTFTSVPTVANILVRNIFRTYSYQDNPYSTSCTISNITIVNVAPVVHTYSYTDYYAPNMTITAAAVVRQLVGYTYTGDKYSISSTITNLVIS